VKQALLTCPHEHLQTATGPRTRRIAIQARVRSTLIERLATGPDATMSEQEADFLADHVADDLMALAPVIPPEHWVANPRT
jgi:hypothetical protein